MAIEQTFFILKPDAFEQHVTAEIYELIRQAGFKLVKQGDVQATRQLLEQHYPHLVDKPFFDDVVAYMTRRPITIGILEKENAVQDWRDLIGATNPNEAAKGTIRNLFGNAEKMENVVHGSESVREAQREICVWFRRNEN